jgi:hypothetical protein
LLALRALFQPYPYRHTPNNLWLYLYNLRENHIRARVQRSINTRKPRKMGRGRPFRL